MADTEPLKVDPEKLSKLHSMAEEAAKKKREVINIILPASTKSLVMPEKMDKTIESIKRITASYQEADKEAMRLGDECFTCQKPVDQVPCLGLTGRIQVNGRQFECYRMDLRCHAGRYQYHKRSMDFISSLKLGDRYKMAYFYHEDFIKDDVIGKAALRYAENLLEKGESLIIGGSVGSGKTVSAIAIGCHAKYLDMRVAYFRVSDFLVEYDTEKELIKLAKDTDLLILDDLCTEMKHAKNEQTLLRIISYRLEQDKATVITCNRSKLDLMGDQETGKVGYYADGRLVDRFGTYNMLFTNQPSKRVKR